MTEHGVSGYIYWGCRCDICREANRLYKLAMRKRSRDADPNYRKRKQEQDKRWRERNPDKVKEYERRNRATHAERRRVSLGRWKADNPEKVREYQRRYRERHKAELRERHRELKRRYKASPRGRAVGALASARRRGLERAATGSASPEQIKARIDYYGGRCYLCGNPANSIDHVIPLALGGSNWPANLRPACIPCNARKRTRPLNSVKEEAALARTGGGM